MRTCLPKIRRFLFSWGWWLIFHKKKRKNGFCEFLCPHKSTLTLLPKWVLAHVRRAPSPIAPPFFFLSCSSRCNRGAMRRSYALMRVSVCRRSCDAGGLAPFGFLRFPVFSVTFFVLLREVRPWGALKRATAKTGHRFWPIYGCFL